MQFRKRDDAVPQAMSLPEGERPSPPYCSIPSRILDERAQVEAVQVSRPPPRWLTREAVPPSRTVHAPPLLSANLADARNDGDVKDARHADPPPQTAVAATPQLDVRCGSRPVCHSLLLRGLPRTSASPVTARHGSLVPPPTLTYIMPRGNGGQQPGTRSVRTKSRSKASSRAEQRGEETWENQSRTRGHLALAPRHPGRTDRPRPPPPPRRPLYPSSTCPAQAPARSSPRSPAPHGTRGARQGAQRGKRPHLALGPGRGVGHAGNNDTGPLKTPGLGHRADLA